jgi:hypothetical protein
MGHTMKSAPANKVVSAQKPRRGERAQARIIMLALVSFLLGVVVTAFWFHFASQHHAENLGSPATDQSNNQQAASLAGDANPPMQPFVPSHPPVDAATIEQVKQAVPNYASVSVEDGTQVLREAALKQFAAAAKEMDVRVRQAEQRLSEAENGQIAAEQQAALANLRQTQAEQTGKLQEITAQLQAQIAALKQLKNAN